MPPRLKRKREEEILPDADPHILPGTILAGPSNANAPTTSLGSATHGSSSGDTAFAVRTLAADRLASNDGHDSPRRRLQPGSGVGSGIGIPSSRAHITVSRPPPSLSEGTAVS